MRAVCWHGARDVRVDHVPDPTILNPRDAIIKVTATTICGSDLHIYDGYIPTMREGDIIGHEFMGEVVETGREVKKLNVGDRVVVSSIIGCGQCFFCQQQSCHCVTIPIQVAGFRNRFLVTALLEFLATPTPLVAMPVPMQSTSGFLLRIMAV